MDKLISLLSNYLAEASIIVQHYGPGVWQATCAMIRISGLYSLGVCIILGIVATIITIVAFHLKKSAKETDWDMEDGPVAFFCISTYVVSVIMWIVFLVNICDFKMWLSIISPQLEIIYQIAQKAGII